MIHVICAHCGSTIKSQESEREVLEFDVCDGCDAGAYGLLPDPDDPESFTFDQGGEEELPF